ncbi:Conserved_hypothetical protein [Hexamita inflata]|uniref:Transmembrane protein n=1 Tax=Hexamita inflata TaxID=28002 RepID=A0AA86P3K1_9EUKA|nr:Conserved hypothetical protein [Hexamita inflata]
MIQTVYVYSVILNSESFTDCFSTLSYIHGDALSSTLTLHLLPFESLTLITDQNMCKNYLIGKIIQVFIHYDDISFPLSASTPAYFPYVYNVEQIVTFQLTPVDYAHIYSKQDAMYELWYDINLVKVNNSIDRIEHTIHNGTGCFSYIQLIYTLHGDMQIISTPNDCFVDFSTVQIIFQYHWDGVNKQIQIQPCTQYCDANEFQTTSSQFNAINVYKVSYSAQVEEFYQAFIKNRLLTIQLALEFDQNGVKTKIIEDINDKYATDTWGCSAQDQANDTYWGLHLYTVLNPDGLFVQIRDTLQNKMKCATPNVVKVKLDHYMKQDNIVKRDQMTVDIDTYNEQVGLQFELTPEYTYFRDHVFLNDSTFSLIIASFMDANDNILYEICQFGKTYLGCVAKQYMEIFKDKMCVTNIFENRPDCRQQGQDANQRNHISIYYKEAGIFYLLGYFNFLDAVVYADYSQKLCFTCDLVDNTFIYALPTCKQNFDEVYTKIKLTGSTVGFFYCNNFDTFQSLNLITRFSMNTLPLILASTAVFIVIVVITSIMLFQQFATN